MYSKIIGVYVALHLWCQGPIRFNVPIQKKLYSQKLRDKYSKNEFQLQALINIQYKAQ